MNMKSCTIALKLWLAALFLIFAPITASAQKSDLVPEEYRMKIDDVDMSKAPTVSIHATFLDKKALPVSPKKIQIMEVYADDELVTASPRLTTLKDSDLPLDLALIVPISQRFSKNDLSEIQDSMAHVIEQARKNDRVAGFFDDGRAINVVPLGPTSEVAQLLKDTKPQAQYSFLYSSLDKAIEEMSDPAKMRKARRAIILVTDGFDTYTYRAEEVQKVVYDTYKLAKENDIRIYVVMLKPIINSLIPLFEGLSRKTGGTYRYVGLSNQISKGIDYAWGEIYGELFIEFEQSNLKKDQDVVYRLEATYEGGLIVKSNPSGEIQVDKVSVNWRRVLIISAIVVGVIIVCVVICFLVLRHRRKKAEEEALLEEQILQEKIERGEVCPKCHRTMLPDWKECMFCAREAAEEIQQAKAEKAKQALAESEKKGKKKDEGKVCPKCGRTMLPQWKECMFCKAGIGGDNNGAQKGMAPTGAEKNKNQNQPAGARICPICHREMKPHWTTCLYCEASTGAGDMGAPKANMQKPTNQPPAGKVCPKCGRPMKAHWDICLYCEANKNFL